MTVTLFWDVTLTSLEDNYWCFRILLPSASEYNVGNVTRRYSLTCHCSLAFNQII